MEKLRFFILGIIVLMLFSIAEAAQLQQGAASTPTILNKDIPLGSAIVSQNGFGQELENKNFGALRQGQIKFQGNSYDFREVIAFHNATGGLDGEVGPRVVTSLTSTVGTQDDYKDSIYLETPRGAMGYYYIFDTPIDVSKATKANPLFMTFYNTQLDIISVTDEKTFDARVWDSRAITMSVGETATIKGKQVRLLNVAGNSATILVGKTQKVINGLDTISGLDVELLDTTANTATIVVGTYSSKTITNGDAWAVPCGRSFVRQGCGKKNPDWVWAVDDLTTNAKGNSLYGQTDSNNPGPTLGVRNDYVVNDKSDNPITIGGRYDFPSNIFGVRFNGLAKPPSYSTIQYMNLGITLQNSDFSSVFQGQNNKPSFLLEASTQQLSLEVLAGNKYVRTNKIWLSTHEANPSQVDVLYFDGKKIALAGTINKAAGNNEIGRINYKQTSGNSAVLRLAEMPDAADDMRLTFDISGDGIADGADNLEVWLGTLNGEFASLGMHANKIKPSLTLDNVKILVAKGRNFQMDVYAKDNKGLDQLKLFEDGRLRLTLFLGGAKQYATTEPFLVNDMNSGTCFFGWLPGLPAGTYHICDHDYTHELIDTDGNSVSATARVHIVDHDVATSCCANVHIPEFNADPPRLIWKGSQAGDIALGTKDEDHRTKYGIIITNPLESSKSSQVLLKIPNTQVKARISVLGLQYP